MDVAKAYKKTTFLWLLQTSIEIVWTIYSKGNEMGKIILSISSFVKAISNPPPTIFRDSIQLDLLAIFPSPTPSSISGHSVASDVGQGVTAPLGLGWIVNALSFASQIAAKREAFVKNNAT
ncbi:hypothetical protein TNIN_9521 [Trichonephila inaurata madagascariensis]|uniref:Uncharacterized protein n=1 Tax=Trichonephila inaurata madagascariensis TaxID=2747483 RepID=A0A8X6MDP2_9ARAC|nr:hypothetical protein TNIN_9521 [Trichonephila inaurata madagascariensis]